MTLYQFIAKRTGYGRRFALQMITEKKVTINGLIAIDGKVQVDPFDLLQLDGQILQSKTPRYVLFHKPVGILSATSDLHHRTVIDCIKTPWAQELHLAGRLDRATSGLVILTNDSRFSESLTKPDEMVPKTYVVDVDGAIPEATLNQFRKGMNFAKEGRRSRPAIVELLSENRCRLTIYEGLHHQIKRMFLRFDLRVIALHRESIANYSIGNLALGAWKEFSPSDRQTTDLPC